MNVLLNTLESTVRALFRPQHVPLPFVVETIAMVTVLIFFPEVAVVA